MAGTSTRRSTRSVSNPPEEIHEDDMYDEELENIKKHIDFHNESDEDSEDEYILSSSDEEYDEKMEKKNMMIMMKIITLKMH